jgi:TatD DNase family protein
MNINNLPIIDTHLHLDLYNNPNKILEEASRLQIDIVAVTNAPFLFKHCKKLCEKYPFIWPSIGMHPELVSQYHSQLDQFYNLMNSTPLVGEIGLDYSLSDKRQRVLQRTVFEKILSACVDKNNKVLSVHSRKAAKDVIEMIGKNYPNTIIMHWYSGPIKYIEEAVDNGFYFSINSAMIKSEKGKSIIRTIPLQRILLETDGPFIQNKGKPVTPKAIQNILHSIAEIKGINIEEINTQILRNEQKVYGSRIRSEGSGKTAGI